MKKKIAIITDTDSSLPREMAAKYNIPQVPISIHLDDSLTGTDHTVNNQELFKKIDEVGKLPTTAAPAPGAFLDYFQRTFDQEKADSLVYFSISSNMSATIESARSAAQELKDLDIHIVDSNTLSMAQGYMVLAAAQAARNGASVEEVIKAAQDIKKRTFLYGALSTLKYLRMSGRVSHIAAGMAGMLDIKPILSVKDGKLDMLEKVRTRKKSWQRMVELARADVGDRSIEKAAILHVNDAASAGQFEEMFRASQNCPAKMPMVDINPGLSVHTGAGLVGVCLVVGN